MTELHYGQKHFEYSRDDVRDLCKYHRLSYYKTYPKLPFFFIVQIELPHFANRINACCSSFIKTEQGGYFLC